MTKSVMAWPVALYSPIWIWHMFYRHVFFSAFMLIQHNFRVLIGAKLASLEVNRSCLTKWGMGKIVRMIYGMKGVHKTKINILTSDSFLIFFICLLEILYSSIWLNFKLFNKMSVLWWVLVSPPPPSTSKSKKKSSLISMKCFRWFNHSITLPPHPVNRNYYPAVSTRQGSTALSTWLLLGNSIHLFFI